MLFVLTRHGGIGRCCECNLIKVCAQFGAAFMLRVKYTCVHARLMGFCLSCADIGSMDSIEHYMVVMRAAAAQIEEDTHYDTLR